MLAEIESSRECWAYQFRSVSNSSHLFSSCFRFLLRFLLLSIPPVLVFTDVQANQRCAVKDSMKVHPELARAPPAGFSFMSTSDSQLMSRMIARGDKEAFNALFNEKIKCHEKYVIPVAWHVIYSTSGEGKVAKKTLENQVKALNGE